MTGSRREGYTVQASLEVGFVGFLFFLNHQINTARGLDNGMRVTEE
jgi:hypothetical protein